MKQVFDVYVHDTKGTWGVCARPGKVLLAHITPDGTLKEERIDPVLLGAEVAKRVRGGFRRRARGLYLRRKQEADGRVTGVFSGAHPELEMPDGHDLVLFVTRPLGVSLDDAIHDWEKLLACNSSSASVRDSWIERMRDAEQYLSAHADAPVFALLLAQWAYDNNQVVVPSKGGLPSEKPALAPIAWRTFLSQWFDERLVQRTQEQLGWSVRDLLTCAPVEVHGDDKHNQKQNGQDDEGWIAQAGMASF